MVLMWLKYDELYAKWGKYGYWVPKYNFLPLVTVFIIELASYNLHAPSVEQRPNDSSLILGETVETTVVRRIAVRGML